MKLIQFLVVVFGVLAFAGPAVCDVFTDPVDLRFYGAAQAERRELSGGVRELFVETESPEKAALWQAKFISDLSFEYLAPKPTVLKGALGFGKVSAYQAPDSWLAVARDGKKVHFYQAKDAESLRRAAKGFGYEATCASVAVPMALDAFARWPFRFYYRLGEQPKDVKDYDERAEIDFCRTNGIGLVFWTGPHWADTAANVLSDAQWGYLLKAAERAGVPVNLNFNSAEFPTRNFYADDMNSRQPGYVGGFVRFGGPHYGGASHLSVDHPAANAHGYESVVKVLKKYDTPNVIGLHEVNGELKHGDHNIFLNYGPEADRSFRDYLKKTYGTVRAYSKLLYGEEGADRLKSWEAVCFPEVARFAGYSSKAVDLAGQWHVKYTDKPVEADFAVGVPTGTNWHLSAKIPAHDLQLFMPDKPAVFKRTFTYNGSGRTWIYLWDLGSKYKEFVEIWLNGKLVKSDKILFNTRHWMYAEATDFLKQGENTVALKLPSGMIGYKIYLTHEEPKFYPYASRVKNRLWYDSVMWNASRREATIFESMNAMRSVDPDKSAVLMAPRAYFRQLREVARLRGGRFHDTGGMGACFHEGLPMLMRGANLPFSLEPGGPAKTASGFHRLMGLYMSEGINAIHYFIHVGNVTWDPEIKAEFLKILPALKMLGRARQEQGDVAMMMDSDINALMGYPWTKDFNVAFPSGYWPWRFNTTLSDFLMDGLIPDDFENGLADRYKVIIDCNNTIMTKAGVEAIRSWVEKGGVYLAMFQSGRNAPDQGDAWMLEPLSGFRGKVFARYTSDGGIEDASQSVFTRQGAADKLTPSMPQAKRATGTALEPTARDAVSLAKWKDGSTAIGYRKVGKGAVYTFGVQLSAHALGHGVWYPEIVADILKAAGAKEKGFSVGKNGQIHTKHYVSDNGLYDVWYVWNGHWENKGEYEIVFSDGVKRELTDVVTGKPLALSGTLEPSDFRMAVSPRLGATDALEHWYDRQCGDNQGTFKEPFSPPNDGFGADTLDISYGWTVNGVRNQDLAVWEKGVGPIASNRNVGVRHVRIPSAWTNGTILLSHAGMYDSTTLSDPRGKDTGMQFFVNGKPLSEKPSGYGFSLRPLPMLKAGDDAEFRLELSSAFGPHFTGTKGATFLTFEPAPEAKLSLAGTWEQSFSPFLDAPRKDVQAPGGEVDAGSKFFRRTVDIPQDFVQPGKRLILHMETKTIGGVIVNGMHVRRHHHGYGERLHLDLTPFLKLGKNELILVSNGWKVPLGTPELWRARRRVAFE